ncbi:MAG: Twitching mobility protein [Synergistetes bacterium ADurb.Bin155]|jgi:twitching motility protein PilT|nr:type IV pilus twitching motility protein PilT [Synergistales bacterium]MBP8995039.1 type IV pilus twitching motility protein PilT [Synergistales bacterium]NMD17589.1 type IV pilus twitching motility protein PilT [Synergistaceae bacterium]OQB47256.1 MAG: Twitching mobility protein [Synergistetes bacterium ADurb.Bin155]
MAISLQAVLAETIRKQATDIHLGTGLHPTVRIDGDLLALTSYGILNAEDVRSMTGEVLTRKQIEELEEKLEMDFSFTFTAPTGESSRFRGNCFFERGNPGMALRTIPTKIRTIAELKLPPRLEEVTKKHRGLFLVTGPTGSGKSTTLASLIQEINHTRACHIVTIEDPIEYLHTSVMALIHQREVGTDTWSFAEALKRVLRQDPDVILIGEMRDLETIAAAVTAAETGHLVFATLHTQGAAQTVDRIIDVFPPYQQQQIRQQLSNVLIGACTQQLIPTPGGGRVVATDLMFATPAVRNLIREAKVSQMVSVMQTGSSFGMHTMDQDLARLVRDGVIPFDTARARAHDPKDLERLVFETAF